MFAKLAYPLYNELVVSLARSLIEYYVLALKPLMVCVEVEEETRAKAVHEPPLT